MLNEVKSRLAGKKIAALVLLFICINASAQNNAATPVVTGFGNPIGEKAEMKIGKEGGSFTSSDGRMRLLVPEDAVSKKTTFSIVPTACFLADSTGTAYKLEPSGVNFKKPIQIIFYYADTEAEENPETGIAMQDDKGKWFAVKKIITDTVAKTFTAHINHFCSFTNFSYSNLYPYSAKLKVNNSLQLKIKTLVPLEEEGDDNLLLLLVPLGQTEIVVNNIWSANGVVNGNSSTGIISGMQDNTANYKAPALIPQQNPVEVSVRQDIENSIKKLTSKITIYDEGYEIKMVASMEGGSPENWGGVTTYKDEGSCIVSLNQNNAKIIKIVNKLEKVTDNCLKIIHNPTSCTGIFHIAGARQIKVTPANPPSQPYPVVEIWFVQYPVEVTRFSFLCPPPPSATGASKGKAGFVAPLGGSPMLMFMGTPALPTYLKFEAKEGEQVKFEKRSPGGEIYYKIWVTKIREE